LTSSPQKQAEFSKNRGFACAPNPEFERNEGTQQNLERQEIREGLLAAQTNHRSEVRSIILFDDRVSNVRIRRANPVDHLFL
jgi:hypothetical protein